MHRFKIYKIQMCKYALINKCDRGENCTFAHDISELRIKPDMRKTKLCKSYILGKCTDQNCIYAHSVNELREVGKPAICQLHREGRCIKGNQCRFAHSIDDINTKLVQFYGMSEDDTNNNNNTNNTNNSNHINSNNTSNNNTTTTTNNNNNNNNNQENESNVGNTKNNAKSSVLNKMNTLIDIKNGSISNNKSKKDTCNSTNCMITKDDCSNSSRQSGTIFPSMCRNKKNNGNGNLNLNKANLIHNVHSHCMDMNSMNFRNETKKETHLSETNNVSYIKERDEECNVHHSSVSNEINGNGPGLNYHNLKDTKLYSIPMNNECHYSFDYDNIIMNKNIKGNYALALRMEKINNSVGVHNNNGMVDNYVQSNLLTEALNEKSVSLNLHSLLALNSSANSVVVNSSPSTLSSDNPISSERLAGLESLIHLNNLNNINTININNVNTINHLNNMNNLNSLNSLNTMNMNVMNYEDMVRKMGTIENAYELMKANSSRNNASSTGTMNHLYPHSNNSIHMNNGGIIDPNVLYNTDNNINGSVINFQKKQKNQYNKLNPVVMNNGSIMNGSIIYNTKSVKEKIQKEINMKNAAFIKNKKMGTNNYLYHESNMKKESSDRGNSNDANMYRLNDSLKQVEQYLYAKQNELLKMMKGSDSKNGMEVESGLPGFRVETPIIRKIKKTLVSEEMDYETNELPTNKMESLLFSNGMADSNKINNNEHGSGINMDTFDPALLNDNRVNVKMLLPMLLQMEKTRRMENEESRRECMIALGNVSDDKKKELNGAGRGGGGGGGILDSVMDQQSKTLDLIKKESGEISKEECTEEKVEINQPQQQQEKQDECELNNTTKENEHENDMESKNEQKKEKKDGENEEEKEQKEETVLNDINKISKEYSVDLSEIEKEKYKEHVSVLNHANNYISNYHNYINEINNDTTENETNGTGPFYIDRRKLVAINTANTTNENSSNFVKYMEKHKEGGGIGGLTDKSNPVMKNGTIGEHVRKDLRPFDEKDYYYRVKKDFIKNINILNGDIETKSSYDEKEMHSPVLLNSSKMNTRNTYSLFYDSHINGKSREPVYGCDRKKEMTNLKKEDGEVEKGIFIPKAMNLLHSYKKGINGSSSYNDLAAINVKNGNEFFLNLLDDSLHVNEKRECGSDTLIDGPEHVNVETSRMLNKEMSSSELNTNNGKKDHSRNGVNGRGRMMGVMNSFFYDQERENALASTDMDSKLYENLEVFKGAEVGEEKNTYSSKFPMMNEYLEEDFKNNDGYGILDRDKLNFKSSSFNNFHHLDMDYECALAKGVPTNGIQNMNLLNESERDLIDKTNGKTTHIFSEISNPNRSLFSNMELPNNRSEEKDQKLFDFNIRNLTMDYIDVEGDNLFLNSASTKEVNSFRLSQGQHTSNNSLSSIDENNNSNMKHVNSTNGNGNKMCINKKNILKEDAFVNRNSSAQGRFVLFPSEKILINDNTTYPFYENMSNINSFVNYEKARESSEFSVFNLMENNNNNNNTSSAIDGHSHISSFYNYAIPSNKKSLQNGEEMDCMEIGSRIGFPFLNNKE